MKISELYQEKIKVQGTAQSQRLLWFIFQFWVTDIFPHSF